MGLYYRLDYVKKSQYRKKDWFSLGNSFKIVSIISSYWVLLFRTLTYNYYGVLFFENSDEVHPRIGLDEFVGV